jgi:hypothetical protein
MRSTFLALALLVGCADDMTPALPTTSGEGSSTGGATTGDAETEGAIDCDATNACLLHPDVCPGPCACDDDAFADEKCVELEVGDFLARCVDGVGLVGECPYGCSVNITDNVAACDPPGECPEGTACDAIPDGCGSCDCAGGSDFCVGDLFFSTQVGCSAAAYCGFGCANGACCTDEICP